MTQGQAGQPGHGGPPGQELEGVAQQDTLHVGDGLHPGGLAHYLGLLHDDPGVGHGQAVEEIHQDHNDEEHKYNEEREGEPRNPRVGVDRDVREFQLSDKHRDGLDDAGPGAIKIDIVFLARNMTGDILRI